MIDFLEDLAVLSDKEINIIFEALNEHLLTMYYRPYERVFINKKSGEIIRINLN